MDVEQYHREAICKITERAKREMQPHIDALSRLEAMKPPKPMMVGRCDITGQPLTIQQQFNQECG